jgi:signal transduction histidine kinase
VKIRRRIDLWRWNVLPIALVLAVHGATHVSGLTVGADSDDTPLVVVLYPDESDGPPGIISVNRAIRSTFTGLSSGRIDIRNEYVDTSRRGDANFMQTQLSLLRQKYAGRKVDLIIAGLSSGLDAALKFRTELFPEVPIVFVAVDQREVVARRLPPDVIGVPIQMDLTGTLDVARLLHPDVRRVFVIAGNAPFDLEWEAEARRAFRPYEGRLEFIYLVGLAMNDLVEKVADLPGDSIIYYLHIHRDGTGKPFIPAEAVELLAARANVPIYGHVDTYVGRGIVGGRVFSFESAGRDAATLGWRILAGEKPANVGIPPGSENILLFDWRRLQQWGIDEATVPTGSEIRYRELGFWDLYKWHIIGVLSLLIFESLLIAGLLLQRASRKRAEKRVLESQRELRMLAGKQLTAQESERRHIARELHDDLNQRLALISVELEMLGRRAPESKPELVERVNELSARVKEVSSSVHDLSHKLHPSKVEQLGLPASLRGLCKELAHSYGIQMEFTNDGLPESVPDTVALCLYRIVQEALANVIKHSRAQRADVELHGNSTSIHLRVVDDGVGFDPSVIDRNGGLGLASMRERLRLLGGKIVIDARPSRGTRIDVEVPLGLTDQTDETLNRQRAGIA